MTVPYTLYANLLATQFTLIMESGLYYLCLFVCLSEFLIIRISEFLKYSLFIFAIHIDGQE